MYTHQRLGKARPANHNTTLAWIRSGLLRDWRGPLGALVGTWFNIPLALAGAVVLGVAGGLWGYLSGGAGLEKLADSEILRHVPLLETLIRSFAGQAGSPLFSVIGLLSGALGGFLGGLILPWTSGLQDPLAGIGQLVALIVCAGAMGTGYTLYRVMAERWLLHQTGARPLSRREAEVVIPLFVECGQRLRLRNVPALLIDDRAGVAANAYTRHIVITSDLLRSFSFRREPIEAVLAHELVHWANGDEITRAFVRGISLPLYLIRNVVSWLIQQFPHPLLKFGLYCFAWPFLLTIRYVIMPMQRMDSRAAEFRADKGAVLAGFGQGMREVLSRDLDLESGRTGWEKAVCATHPPLETRLERLEENDQRYTLQEEEAPPERVEPSTDPATLAIVWPPQEKHRNVWIGVGVTLVSMAMLLGGLSLVQFLAFTPERTIKAFFADLSDHDGRSALARVDLVAGRSNNGESGSFLTAGLGDTGNPVMISAQVLAAKEYRAPSQVRIVSVNYEQDTTVVRVKYELNGDHEADFKLKRFAAGVFREWKIVDGLPLMSVSARWDGGEFTLNGVKQELGGEAGYEVFAPPGIYTFSGPKSALVEVAQQSVALRVREQNKVELNPSIIADARAKLEAKVRQYLDECAKSTSESPPDCPFDGRSYYDLTNVKWQIVSYPSLTVTPTDMLNAKVEGVKGVARITADYSGYSGSQRYTDDVSFSVSGTAKVNAGELQWIAGR